VIGRCIVDVGIRNKLNELRERKEERKRESESKRKKEKRKRLK
jgi:hypothetical protein